MLLSTSVARAIYEVGYVIGRYTCAELYPLGIFPTPHCYSQWGLYSTASGQGQLISFPISFPNLCAAASAKGTHSGGWGDSSENACVVNSIEMLNTTGMKIGWSLAINGQNLSGAGSWFAIGY